MSAGRKHRDGPSPNELRMRAELDRLRRELQKIKKSDTVAPGESALETESLRGQVADLTQTKQRLSRLYFSQVEENRKRAKKLHHLLEQIGQLNANLDLDALMQRMAETIRASLGYRIVLIRLREPGTAVLRARATAGLPPEARARLDGEEVRLEDFLSWLRDEFRISRSYFIPHGTDLARALPSGHTSDLGPREEYEWHPDDVLLVPLFNRTGDLVAYLSVDDPEDRLVPSRESVEMLEIFGTHAVVALENARLYQQLERHTRELEEAGKRMQEMNALKSNFVSTVSHELRTPLTAIKAYVDTLLAAAPGEVAHEQLQRFLGIVNEETQRLSRLIESVLDLNRFDSGNMRLERRSVDFAEVVEETARLLRPVALAGKVELVLEVEVEDSRVEADRDQMRQLVLHLGSNAVKFTPEGGRVEMRMRGDDRDITLEVEDTGIGIPEQALEKIFERFYQVDSSLVRRYGGTGLGLAICKSIVEWHGGRVLARSEQGRGSCFTVVLPRRTGPRVAVRPSHRPEAATEDVLRLGIEMVAEVMNARVVSLLTPEPEGHLIVRAALGLDESVVREARIEPGKGVAGWVVENRRPVCVSGPTHGDEVTGSGRVQYRSGSFLSVPLEVEGELLGVLNVTDPVSQKPFEAEDCHLLLQLAGRVASTWHEALEMERRQVGVEGSKHALRQVLQHLERGRRSAPDRIRLARTLARLLGLAESEIGLVSFAASVHDIGMGRVGESVVEGGGTLSPSDRIAVESHPEMGAELLRPFESMGAVRDIVLSHHEWWDGSGYPRGLAGDEIPIGSRILAVVDAWESMTVGRAHRPMLSRSEALAELRSGAAKQFDPRVLDVFERALDEVEREEPQAQSGTTPPERDRNAA